jgi:hypothetical protein
MSRVEPKERPAKREAKGGRREAGDFDRKPIRIESDKRPGDETMRIPR